MRKIIYLLFAIVILSCSQEEGIINAGLDNQNEVSGFKVSKQELISNVSEFLNEFYSEETSTRSSGSSNYIPKIKSISILTKDDLPQTIQTRSSAEGIRVDSLIYFVDLDEGFVIAGADKRTMPVFALIDAGSFSKEILKSGNANNIPFQEYIERTLYVINEDIRANELYSVNSSATRAYPIKERIFPLLGLTKWNQKPSPYNLYCPAGTPTGCVMTALAQVSSYYQSPKSVYYGDNIQENPLLMGFTLNLNWPDILAVSNANSGGMPSASYFFTETGFPNAAQRVGLYMRYIGKMLNATYAPDGTSASFDSAINFMRNIIGLQATDQHQFNRTNVYNQIKGGNLVVLSGYANSSGGSRTDGHMWIADGVFVCHHNHQYFHYNWGWGGFQNGYYFEDRWAPGLKEFDDAGNEIPQVDYGKDYKYKLTGSYISW